MLIRAELLNPINSTIIYLPIIVIHEKNTNKHLLYLIVLLC